MPNPDRQTDSIKDLDQTLLQTLELTCQKYVLDPACLQTSKAGWEAFNILGNDIFKTLKYDLELNFDKCLISFDIISLPENPEWPPGNPQDFDFTHPDYGMLFLNFFGFDFDETKSTIKDRFYRLIAQEANDPLIEKPSNDLIMGKKTASYHYEKVRKQIEEQADYSKSKISKINFIYQVLAEEFNIRDIFLTTSVVKMPFSMQVNGLITAFTIVFYNEKTMAYTEHDLQKFEHIGKQLSQWLTFDNSKKSIKYIDNTMDKQKGDIEQDQTITQLYEIEKQFKQLLAVVDLKQPKVKQVVRLIRDGASEVLYPALYLPEPQAADVKYTPYKDKPLDFLKEHYANYLTFFQAPQDTLFQDQLSQFDEKLKNAVRNQIKKLIDKKTDYQGLEMKPFNEVVKPAHVKNDMIYQQLSAEDIKLVKRLSVLINERENPTVNRKSYKKRK